MSFDPEVPYAGVLLCPDHLVEFKEDCDKCRDEFVAKSEALDKQAKYVTRTTRDANIGVPPEAILGAQIAAIMETITGGNVRARMDLEARVGAIMAEQAKATVEAANKRNRLYVPGRQNHVRPTR